MNKLSKNKISEIKRLRGMGWSLPEIKSKVGVGYGTVYRYIKNVPILPEYRKEWLGKRSGSIKRKKILEEKAREEARQVIVSLSKKEKIVFMSALYWSEGNKKDFNLINSDPDLIKIFVKGLRDLFGVSSDRFKISIRIYEDLDKIKCLNFWSGITKVPVHKFVSANVLKGKKKGKLNNGMCRVRVKKAGNLLKYMLAIRDEIVRKF